MEEQFFWQDSQNAVIEQSVTVQPASKDETKDPIMADTNASAISSQSEFLYDTLFSPRYAAQDSEIYQHKINPHANDYKFALILIGILIYLTWITYTYHKELRENLTVLVNSNLGQQIFRDREFSANIFKFITFSNFAAVSGVSIYLIANRFGWPQLFSSFWLNMLTAIALVIILYLIKSLVYGILNRIFQLGPVVSYFRFNSLVIYQMLGIALFPLVLLAVFARPPVNDWSLYASIGITAVALLIRIIKGFSLMGMVRGFQIHYFLLYICALEIAPLLILIKLFSMWA